MTALVQIFERIAFDHFAPHTRTIHGANGVGPLRTVTQSPTLAHLPSDTLLSCFRRLSMLICAMGLVLLLGACKPIKFDWKQSLAIWVDTPSGTMTAVADQFIAAKYYTRPLFATTTTLEMQHRGDPVILDLGGGNILFVIQSKYAALSVYRDMGSRRQIFEALTAPQPTQPRVIDHMDPNATRAFHFFRFKDLTDPSSIERVDPNDLAASFGPGFTLTKILFSARAADITPDIGRAPEVLTGQVDKILPWLAAHQTYLKLPRPGKPGLGFYPDDLRSGIID